MDGTVDGKEWQTFCAKHIRFEDYWGRVFMNVYFMKKKHALDSLEGARNLFDAMERQIKHIFEES